MKCGEVIACPQGKCGEHFSGLCQAHVRVPQEDGSVVYRQCLKHPVHGKKTCASHGAKGGRPATTGEDTKIGRLIRSVPPEVLAHFESSLGNPDQLALKEHIALLDARMNQILEHISVLGKPKSWQRAWQLIEKMRTQTDPKALGVTMEELVSLVQDGLEQSAAWDEFLQIVGERRKLTEAETRRRLAAENVMTRQEAQAFTVVLLHAVRKHVPNAAQQQAVFRDVAGALALTTLSTRRLKAEELL